MFKNRKLLGILLSIFMVLALTVSGFAYYKYTQESGANFYVGTGDKADAQEDTNEMRQILDDLGDLLGHSKRDDLYPKDGTTGGTLSVFTNIVYCNDYDHPDDAITAIASANKTLLVTEAETCDTNFTVPANVTVKFERGGKWTINGEYFGDTTFTGTGLNDATIGGTYTGTADLNYKIEIDGTGTPDTFKWSDDGGSTWDATLVAIDGTAQALNNGVTVTFGATTGHTLADYWTVTAYHAITVTFNGQIDAGLWQIFALTGTGTTVLDTGSCSEVYPEWWGAKGDGSTDDAAIFNTVLTILDASDVKTMRLDKKVYKITDTLVMYPSISIIGRNNYPVSIHQFNEEQPSTKILFLPTSEKDLFDITQNLDTGYVPKVYIGGILLYGNTNGEVTHSRYAINSKAAQSVFENIGIAWFQAGIYCNYTMTNKYENIYIGNCSVSCIYTSEDNNTSDTFDNVIMRDAPWGVILRKAKDFRFINCLFESLTVGGVNIYKEVGTVSFLSTYGENTPASSDGSDYGMFYIHHDGTTASGGNITINGLFIGHTVSKYGSFLDVEYTSSASHINVLNSYYDKFTNGIKASLVNTTDYSIFLSENITGDNVANLLLNTTNKLVNSKHKVNNVEIIPESQCLLAQSDTYVKSTCKYGTDFWAYYATDPTKDLLGTESGRSWMTSGGIVTNQRFHIDLGSAVVVKRIYYENFHNIGTNTQRGVQNFTFWGSNTGAGSFDDLVWGNDEGWTQLTTSQSTFDEHSAANEADPKYITIKNNTAYRYYAFKFADNYGHATYMGLRHVELQIKGEITTGKINLEQVIEDIGTFTPTKKIIIEVNGVEYYVQLDPVL